MKLTSPRTLLACLPFLALAPSLAPAQAEAATVTIYSSSVATFNANGSYTPYNYFLSGPGGSGERRVVGEVPLAAIPANVDITSAIVSVGANGISADTPNTIHVYGYTGDGVAAGTDVGLGTNLGHRDNVNYPGFSLDITSFVSSLRDANAAFAGFVLRNTSPLGFINSGAPVLTINYTERLPAPPAGPASVPTPAAATAGLALLAALAAHRRRQGAAGPRHRHLA